MTEIPDALTTSALRRRPMFWDGKRVAEIALAEANEELFAPPDTGLSRVFESEGREWLPGELRGLAWLHDRIAPWVTFYLVPRLEGVTNLKHWGEFPRKGEVEPIVSFPNAATVQFGGMYLPYRPAVVVTVCRRSPYRTFRSAAHELFHAVDNYLMPNERLALYMWARTREPASVAGESPYMRAPIEYRARAFEIWADPLLAQLAKGHLPDSPFRWPMKSNRAERIFGRAWDGKIAWRRSRHHTTLHRRWARLRDAFFLPVDPPIGDVFS